jgi:glutaconate CoA-transferase, subunit B
VTKVITDLGILEPDPESKELTLTSLYPGVTAEDARAGTAWELAVADEVGAEEAPTDAELEALRALETNGGER